VNQADLRAAPRLPRRDLLALVCATSAAPFLAACSPDADAGKTYAVRATATGAPFTFRDVKSNTLIGAMIDIAHAVAEDAGLKIQVETVVFADLVPSLSAHKIDLVAAAVLRTAEREQIASFTNPVYTYGGGVMLPAGDPRPCPNLGALTGLTVGVQTGTRFVTQLEEAGVASIKTYDNLADIMQGIDAGQLQAGYGSYPINVYHLRNAPDMKLRLADDFVPPSREEVSLIARKDDFRLIAKLNVSIARIKTSKIQTILKRWSMV
jgi:polar amino acid transport system substrate-binding protein